MTTTYTATCATDGTRTPVVAAPAGTLCDCGTPAVWCEVAGTARVPFTTGVCKGCMDEYDWTVWPDPHTPTVTRVQARSKGDKGWTEVVLAVASDDPRLLGYVASLRSQGMRVRVS